MYACTRVHMPRCLATAIRFSPFNLEKGIKDQLISRQFPSWKVCRLRVGRLSSPPLKPLFHCIHCNNNRQTRQNELPLSFSQSSFLGVAYSVDILVCILADLSLNVYQHVSVRIDMGVLFCGGVFSVHFFIIINRITL